MTDKTKSGNPTQPGYRSTASNNTKKRKSGNIIQRFIQIVKRLNWKGRTLLAALLMLAIVSIMAAVKQPEGQAPPDNDAPPEEYIFTDGNGNPVDWQAMTCAWAAEAGFVKRYELTDAERWEIASVITAEAEGEPYAGKVAAAQCILQACEDDGIRPFEALTRYKYSRHRPEPSAEALEAVQAVFDFGHIATHEPIKYFYNPARVVSDFHEAQAYVMTINSHRFFAEKETD